MHRVRPVRRSSAYVLPLQTEQVEEGRPGERLRNGLGPTIVGGPAESGTTAILSVQRSGEQSAGTFNGFGDGHGRPESGSLCDAKRLRVSSCSAAATDDAGGWPAYARQRM